MKIKTFFNGGNSDAEPTDVTDMAIPDQSITIREILMNFTRGTMLPPPIETGKDETFDTEIANFDDLVDASYALRSSVERLGEKRATAKEIKQEAETPTADIKAKTADPMSASEEG